MPKKFLLIILTSFVFFTLFFFLSSFVVIYVYAENWACVVFPPVVAYFVLAGLRLKREPKLTAKVLQAVSAVSGLPMLLALFFLAGEAILRPGIISLGQGISPVIPDFFASFFSLVIMCNLIGLVPAFITALVVTGFVLPKPKESR